ncbi:carbohydrate kinase family protein [Methanobacterium sp. ACI-7]|uniref:carbohydrate kinase family protein n=1 Tax=unclassified Methanobacterium TaxID=2627676 RepID=UPI0039C37EFB
MSVDVVGLGACNVDFLQKIPRFAVPDDEVEIKELLLSVGGSASNFTVGLSRLNVNTGIIARVGNDYFGKVAKGQFKNEGVDTKRLLKTELQTGMVFIAIEPQGERSMYTFIGANKKFKLQEEDIKYIKHSKILHVTQMYKDVVEQASKHANILSFNPGAILSSFGIQELSKIIEKTDILFLNKKEMNILTHKSIDEGAHLLLDMGAQMVIVTCSENGANLYTQKGTIHSPGLKINAIDTTGAGDSFAAGFIAAYSKGKGLKECLDYANIVASCCVQKLGALSTPHYSKLNIKI